MSTRLRRRLGALSAGALLLAAAAWQVNRVRTVPLSRLLSPHYWLMHWQGRDLFDAQTGLLQQGDPRVPEVALTIDDGPDPRYGPEIARVLKEKGVPATFFLVGIRAKQYPDLVRQFARDGFTLGNHTYDHQRLDALKPHEIASELRLGDAHIAQITGRHCWLMRPPGVQYNDKVLDVAKALGYVTVSWTVGARDYDPQPPSFISERVIDRTRPGAIVLLHQDTPATAAALPAIIDTLRARGYRFVSLESMLARLKVQPPSRLAAADRLTKR